VPGAVTPGQLAYEAWRETFRSDAPWSDIGDHERAAWEAAAQAAIDASDSTALAQLAMAQEAISDLAAGRDGRCYGRFL
jgi:hypothetical protein